MNLLKIINKIISEKGLLFSDFFCIFVKKVLDIKRFKMKKILKK